MYDIVLKLISPLFSVLNFYQYLYDQNSVKMLANPYTWRHSAYWIYTSLTHVHVYKRSVSLHN